MGCQDQVRKEDRTGPARDSRETGGRRSDRKIGRAKLSSNGELVLEGLKAKVERKLGEWRVAWSPQHLDHPLREESGAEQRG
jgi:hypothetical protein